MLPRRLLAAVVAGAALAAVACQPQHTDSALLSTVEDEDSLIVGTRFTQPGMSKRTVDGRFEGFDIDVARYVAGELGVDDDDIEWYDLVAADREKALVDGDVDLVVASYSITDDRKRQVDFAGPYFVTGQAVLARLSDDDITGPQSLDGKRLCSVTGSTSATHVKAEFAGSVELAEYPRYDACVTALLAKQVDAVTTDETILAGYAAEHPELLRIVGEPFSEERYGVGLRRGDTEGRAAVNEALRSMIRSGEWRRSLQRHFGASDFEIPNPPPVSGQ